MPPHVRDVPAGRADGAAVSEIVKIEGFEFRRVSGEGVEISCEECGFCVEVPMSALAAFVDSARQLSSEPADERPPIGAAAKPSAGK